MSRIRKYIFFVTTCVLGSPFNLWYIVQFDPNFHPVEAIVSSVQIVNAILKASRDIADGCIYSVDFYYVLCCCCGVVFLVICFVKNIRGYYREEKVCYLVINIVGVLVSIPSACLGYLFMFALYSEELPDCQGYYL